MQQRAEMEEATSSPADRHVSSSCESSTRKRKQPLALLDGSKVVLQLARGTAFSYDPQCRLLFSTGGISVERDNSGFFVGVNNGTNRVETAVLDSGTPGLRFVPIRIAEFGVIYTSESAVCATVGVSVSRTKVKSRALPYRSCYKFTCVRNGVFVGLESGAVGSTARMTDSSGAWDVGTATQAAEEMALSTMDTTVGLLLLRADESIFRYTLASGENAQLHSSQLLAWSLTCTFDVREFCCLRFAQGVRGPGTVWVLGKAKGSGNRSF